jgi:iron complex outermembrane receptor protein
MSLPYPAPAFAAGALLALAAGTAPAQHTHALEEIVVTARPIGSRDVAHIPQPVDVLAGTELREKLAATLGETLAREPGVSAGDFGQGASRPVIRGLAGGRVRMLENGIGSLDASTVSADHAVGIEPAHAEQIEILRGPATLIYGSDAFAGLVNVVNGRLPVAADRQARLEARARYNAALDERLVSLRADGRLDDVIGLHVDVLHRGSGDYESGAGRVRNSFVTTDDLSAGLGGIGARGYLAAAFGRYASKYGIPVDAVEEETPFIDLDQDRVDLAGMLEEPIPGLAAASVRIGYVDYEHVEFEAPREPGTRFTNNEWEGRIEFQHQPMGEWNGVFGVHYRNRSLDARGDEAYVPGTKTRSTGVFVMEETDRGRWHAEFGGRYEHVRADPTDLTGLPEATHDLFSASAGLVWRFPDEHALGLSLTRAQRAPAPEELFADGPHLATGTFEIGAADLGEETAHNVDLGLRRDGERWSWTMNLYVNAISDFIFQRFTDLDGDGRADRVDGGGASGDEFLRVRYAQTDALFYGIEAESRVEVFDDDRGHLDLTLWGDWVRARFDDAGDLPRIPPARIGLGADWSRGGWHADVSLLRVFRQGHTAQLESATGGYTLLDLGLRRDLRLDGLDAGIHLRAGNLLDATALRHTSFLKDRAPLPGRAITAELELAW